MSENRCICCGAAIPEGRQVCPRCENLGDLAWKVPYSGGDNNVPSKAERMLVEIGYHRDPENGNRFYHLEEPMSITLEDDGVRFNDEGAEIKVGLREVLAAAQLIKEIDDGNP